MTPVWEVDLFVDGPVTIRNRFRGEQQKGFRPDDPFYSDVRLEGRAPLGIRATITARAESEEAAGRAALVFFGEMLDALTLAINQPMVVSLAERDRILRRRFDARRIVEHTEIESAFREAHFQRMGSPSFLKGLGWYRKGITTEDPLDAYLALWNSIEIVASKYYRFVPSIDQDRAKSGSKSQIWECFKALWGDCERWPIITADRDWIDESSEIRIDVAHGRKGVTAEQITRVGEKLSPISQVAYRFLRDWRDRFLELDRNPPSESLLNS